MTIPQSFPFTFNEVTVKFPHESPYLAQRAIMSCAIKACISQENALLESPTGTGKSLALLSSTLAYQENVGKHPILSPEKRNPFEHHNEEIIIEDIESVADKIDERVAPSFTKASQLYRDQQKSGTSVQIPNPPEDMPRCNVVLKRHNVPIWYTSRTHTQLKQLIGELKKLDYHPQMTILASRKRLCLFKQVSQSSNVDMECLSALSKNKCPYLFEKKIPPDFRPFGPLEKFDTDDLLRYCEQRMLCPYRLSRFIMKSADLVFCPYNFIMNPKVKGQMMLTILGVVLVIDEAHNVESTIKESTSFDHDRGGLMMSVGLLNKYLSAQEDKDFQENVTIIRDLFSSYLRYINDKSLLLREKDRIEYIEESNVEFFKSLGVTKLTWPRIREALDYTFVVGNAGRLPGVGTPQKISMSVLDYLEQFYVVVALCFKKNCRFMNAFKLVLNLGSVPEEDHLMAINLDPGAYFSTVADEVNTVILSSGTLSPLNQMAVELGTSFKVLLSASHIISPHQLVIYTIGQGLKGTELLGTYKNMEMNREKIELELGNILIKILGSIPGGVLFFMPSHNSLASLIATWQKKGIIEEISKIKPIFFEEQSLNAQMYIDYKTSIEKDGGAILFGVCRGRMSEGIDFYDDQARSVIIFGIPYPPMNDRDIRLKMQFNDERYDSYSAVNGSTEMSGMSGSEWYDAQAYRALFQATGRCIRHSKDYGSIILIDSRFSKQVSRFPRWMQLSFVGKKSDKSVDDTNANDLPDLLNSFYHEMNIEFPPRSMLRKSSPTSICCHNCGRKIVEVESLDDGIISCLQVAGKPGLYEICQSNVDEGFIFIKKDDQKRIGDEIKFDDAVYSDKDLAAYQPILCPCGEIVGAIFKVGKLDDLTFLDGMFLPLLKVVGNQGKVTMPLSTVLEVKRSYTFLPQGKGQQVLCLTPSIC